MSFFKQSKASSMNDQVCLVTALKTLQYNPVVESNQTVRGDMRNDDRKGFDVVLKKEDTGYRGDIGFIKDQTGNYSVGFDSFIIRAFTPQAFLKQVEEKYLVAKAQKIANGLGLEFLAMKPVKNKAGEEVIRMQYRKVGVAA